MTKKILTLALAFLLPRVARAGTTYGAEDANIKQVNGGTVATGLGASSPQALRVVLSNDSSVSLSAGSVSVGTFSAAGIFLSAPQTLSNGATALLLLDVNGFLTVDLKTAIPAGANLIGKVGFDQTTPGTTNGVVANQGSVALMQIEDAQGNVLDVGFEAGGGSVPVVAQPMTADTLGRFNITVTGASTQVLAANANRKAVECSTPNTNTDYIFCNWGQTAAATDPIILGANSNYTNPVNVITTRALNCIAASATQNFRCQEYAP